MTPDGHAHDNYRGHTRLRIQLQSMIGVTLYIMPYYIT